MGDMPLHGLAWALAGLATAAISVLGALVQTGVLVSRAPSGKRLVHLRAALAGPLVATVIALIGALSIDQFDASTKATLDTGWILLPAAAAGAWFALNRWLIRGL